MGGGGFIVALMANSLKARPAQRSKDDPSRVERKASQYSNYCSDSSVVGLPFRSSLFGLLQEPSLSLSLHTKECLLHFIKEAGHCDYYYIISIFPDPLPLDVSPRQIRLLYLVNLHQQFLSVRSNSAQKNRRDEDGTEMRIKDRQTDSKTAFQHNGSINVAIDPRQS